MKKLIKTISLIMVFAVVCTIISACSIKDLPGTDNTESTTKGATEEATKPEENEAATEATEEVSEASEEAESAATEDTGEATESAEVPSTINTSDVDISKAVENTTPEAPAQLGEWVKSTRYNVESQGYDTIYWRVVGVTADCQSDIDRYNGENHIYTIDPLTDEHLTYYKVSYQVYFPEDFPQRDWGITSCDVDIRIVNPQGGSFSWKNGTTYIGLSRTVDISADQEIHSGDVFDGETIFAMLNDPSIEYVFEYRHPSAGEGDTTLYDYVASN